MPPKAKASNGGEPSDHKYKVMDIVLAKIKGYPSWPAQVVEESSLPPKVKADRPPKGQGRIPVQFFPVGDYGWMGSRDISKLTPEDIEKYLADPSKKSGDLRNAYETAKDPGPWRDQQAENERLRQEEAARDHDDLADADEDELASEPEAGGGKKRKRKEGKPKETPEEAKKKKKAKLDSLAKKRKADKADSKGADPNIESEDEAATAAPTSASTKAAKTTKKKADEATEEGEKQAITWRSKLQKCFFGKSSVPSDADMPQMDEIFTAMEKAEMKERWLAASKLYKVLKNMNREDSKIPRDEEFKFRERARALLEKWNIKPAANGSKDGDAEPQENGSKGDDPKSEPKSDDAKADESKIEADEPAKDANGTADMEVDKPEGEATPAKDE